MPCVSCGFVKKKYYICAKCNKTVCHKCVSAGVCKDCFNIVETYSYTPYYVYAEK